MHKLHIPVMGTGFSIDTPIRVAPFGISSVMSIMDDMLIEKIREHYCNKFNLNFSKVPSPCKGVQSNLRRKQLNNLPSLQVVAIRNVD